MSLTLEELSSTGNASTKFTVMYTRKLTQKQKTWLDGLITVNENTRKIALYDEEDSNGRALYTTTLKEQIWTTEHDCGIIKLGAFLIDYSEAAATTNNTPSASAVTSNTPSALSQNTGKKSSTSTSFPTPTVVKHKFSVSSSTRIPTSPVVSGGYSILTLYQSSEDSNTSKMRFKCLRAPISKGKKKTWDDCIVQLEPLTRRITLYEVLYQGSSGDDLLNTHNNTLLITGRNLGSKVLSLYDWEKNCPDGTMVLMNHFVDYSDATQVPCVMKAAAVPVTSSSLTMGTPHQKPPPPEKVVVVNENQQPPSQLNMTSSADRTARLPTTTPLNKHVISRATCEFLQLNAKRIKRSNEEVLKLFEDATEILQQKK